MIKSIALFFILLLSIESFAQKSDYTLQYIEGFHSFRTWHKGDRIRVITMNGNIVSGTLSMTDTNSILVNDVVVPLSSIKKISKIPWVVLSLSAAGLAAAVFVHPIFAFSSFFLGGLHFSMPYKVTKTHRFYVMAKGRKMQKPIIPVVYFYDSLQTAQRKYRLYLYPVGIFNDHKEYRAFDYLTVRTSEKGFLKGRIQFVDQRHILIGEDTVDIGKIEMIQHTRYKPNSDTLAIDTTKWYKAKDNVTFRHSQCRLNYLKSNSPGNYFSAGVDLPKLFVPKPNICIDYYLQSHVGISLSGAWKPLQPEGQGFFFTWKSNVDYISESWQWKVNPFWWFRFQNDLSAYRLGVYGRYKKLQANHVYVDVWHEYDPIYYEVLYYHNSELYGTGISFGSINQKNSGFSFDLNFGLDKVVTCDSLPWGLPSSPGMLTARSNQLYPHFDFSVFYSFRFNKQPKRRNRIE